MMQVHTITDAVFRAIQEEAISNQRQLEAMDHKLAAVLQEKISLQAQLEDTERAYDRSLQENLKLQAENERLKIGEAIDEEIIKALDEMIPEEKPIGIAMSDAEAGEPLHVEMFGTTVHNFSGYSPEAMHRMAENLWKENQSLKSRMPVAQRDRAIYAARIKRQREKLKLLGELLGELLDVVTPLIEEVDAALTHARVHGVPATLPDPPKMRHAVSTYYSLFTQATEVLVHERQQ